MEPKLKRTCVSSLEMHLVEDDDERDDKGVVDARVDGDAVRILPQQRAHHAEPPVYLRQATNPFSVQLSKKANGKETLPRLPWR